MRIDIHPAPGKASTQQVEVILTQRLQRLEREAFGVRDAEARKRLQRKYRRIIVVIPQRSVDTEQSLAQAQIAMQGWQRGVGLIDQCSIDGARHVVGELRRLERTGEFACLGA